LRPAILPLSLSLSLSLFISSSIVIVIVIFICQIAVEPRMFLSRSLWCLCVVLTVSAQPVCLTPNATTAPVAQWFTNPSNVLLDASANNRTTLRIGTGDVPQLFNIQSTAGPSVFARFGGSSGLQVRASTKATDTVF
jgi:hypothetical protein